MRTSRAPGSSVDEATGRRQEDVSGRKAGGGPRGLRARLTPFASPPWLKAPLLLFRFPRLLVALGGAVFILAVVTASSPLFLSSAGNRILSNTIATACPWDVGISFTTPLQVLRTSQGLPNGLGAGSAYAGAEATDFRTAVVIVAVFRQRDRGGLVLADLLEKQIGPPTSFCFTEPHMPTLVVSSGMFAISIFFVIVFPL